MNDQAKLLAFVGAIAFQIAVILLLVFMKVAILGSGTDLALKLAPVDPRDPLRGDYASVRYDISSVSTYQFSGNASTLKRGDRVYVTLARSEKFWNAIDAGSIPPQEENAVFIVGTVEQVTVTPHLRPAPLFTDVPTEFPIEDPSGDGVIQILYGIEEYFIPEGTGTRLNVWGPDDEAYARVVVSERGAPVLKALYVNDKPWP